MNTRRKLLIALGAGALTVSFGTLGQQQNKVWRIGYLSPFQSGNDPRFEVFKQQLRDLGQVEGKTITIDYLLAEGKSERLPELAAELVRRNVDIILTGGGTPAATAARNAAGTIPVVFQGVGDPVGQGFVTSLARPDGNMTGISDQQPEVGPKLLQFLKEIVPSTKRVAILANPNNSSMPLRLSAMQAAARVLRIDVAVVSAGSPAEFDGAFVEIVRGRAAGLVVPRDPMFVGEAVRLMTLAARHRLPTMGGDQSVPESGGLASYGPNRLDLIRRAAILVDKIVKGAKPSDLPVEQPTKFELVVNLRTAKDLGITIPYSILVSAEKVIE